MDSGSVSTATAALIGAGGAILGGMLTSGTQLVIESRREARDGKRREAREAATLRLATRLVVEELADSEALLREAARSREYWPAERQLSSAVWTEYRAVLAHSVESPLSWRIITAGYDAANRINWLCHERWERARNTPPSTLAREALKVMPEVYIRPYAWIEPEDETRAAWRAIRASIAELEQTIHVTGPASRMLREEADIEREVWPHGDGDDYHEDPIAPDS